VVDDRRCNDVDQEAEKGTVLVERVVAAADRVYTQVLTLV
jgi:hypothetical protein